MPSPDVIRAAAEFGIALGTIGGILWAVARFIFEPHMRRVVQVVVETEFRKREAAHKTEVDAVTALANRIAGIEDRMGKAEQSNTRTEEAVERIEAATARQTVMLERISEAMGAMHEQVGRLDERTTRVPTTRSRK